MSKLYLVATPIGNLGDITPRAVEVLENADFIAAEDTRHTLGLLNHLGIKKPMISYYEHNKRERGEYITERIKAGEVCALVTDAGTPAISDPGEDIVRLCAELGIDVIPIPGACAFVQALIASGLPTGRFSFEGFLSVNKIARKKHLEEIAHHTQTLIFYEAPHKLKATLSDLYEFFGDRKISIAREITKLHEQIIRTTLKDAALMYEAAAPRGEFVLVVEGYQKTEAAVDISEESIVRTVTELMEEGADKKEAIKLTAARLGIPKRRVYEYMIGK